MPNKQISEERQAAYYIGAVIMGIGVLMFLSVFVTAFSSFGGSMPGSTGPDMQSIGFRALGGMILMAVGAGIRGIGAAGVAGSGVVLDPEKAREDLEPWARMAGGMVKDAVDESGLDLGHVANHEDHEDTAEMPFDEKLRRLAKLHTEGILSDDEYAKEKQKMLDEQ